jgi:hypothetical protein
LKNLGFRGLCVTTKGILDEFSSIFFKVGFLNSVIGIILDFSIAESIRFLGYFCRNKKELSSDNLTSLRCLSATILQTRLAMLIGMFLFVWEGWQELKTRYW